MLAYTARGFGASGGLVHLDAPDFEVADARRLIDLLAGAPRGAQDGPGDPRVGVAGGSYGGALTLLLAGPTAGRRDRSPDHLERPGAGTVPPVRGGRHRGACRPGADRRPGVFKKAWAGVFLGPGGAAAAAPAGPARAGRPAQRADRERRRPGGSAALPDRAAAGSRPTSAPPTRRSRHRRADAGRLDLLAELEPGPVLDRITAPTLLVQGEADSLFPLSEADANARGIAANGTPVKVVWYGGGHDGGLDETDRLRSLVLAWFDRYLKRDGSPPDTRFEVTVPAAAMSSADSNPAPQVRVAPAEPGVTGAGAVPTRAVPLSGRAQPSSRRPGGRRPR